MTRTHLFFSIFGIAVAIWLVDAASFTLFHPEISFREALVFQIPAMEIYERLFVVGGLFLVGLIGCRLIRCNQKTKEVLGAEQRLLDSILNSVNEALLVRDRDYNIIKTNPTVEKIFARAAPLLGKKCYAAIRKLAEPCSNCPASQAMEKREAVNLIFPKNEVIPGETGWLELSAYPIIDPATGEAAAAVEFVRDITCRKQSEEALEESEHRYRLLVSHIPAVIFKGYPDWSVDLVDNKIEELTGYSQEDFNSRRLKWLDLILPEDLLKVQKTFLEALKGGKSYVREYRIRHRAGHILWIQSRGQIIVNDRGKVEYISGVFFDITERRQSEEALRRSEASLAEAQRLAHLGNWEWDIPSNTVSWSDEIYRIFDLSPREFGHSYESFLAMIHPDDREAMKHAIAGVLQGKENYSLGYRVIRPDGTQRFLYDHARIDYDAQGRALRMVGTTQDITPLKEAQQALEESEKRYRLLAESATDVIFTTDLELQLTYISPSIQLLTGYTPEEILPRRLEEILAPTSAELARKAFAEEMALQEQNPDSARSRTLELEHYCKDASPIWTEVKANFMRDAQGQLVGVQGVTRDITARRVLEEQLQQAQKMEVVGRLAGGVAHDFNNLLTAILGYAGLLRSSLNPGDPAGHDLAEIVKAGERAALLTRQLMAFSRRQVLHPEAMDLSQVVNNLGKMLKRVIGEDIELEISPASDLGQALADPGQIEQVILNLTVNARDAMPHGGRLAIKTANVFLDDTFVQGHAHQVLPGPYVLLEVSDTGCGMDAATRSHIFEPFFTTKAVGKGTGLGLSTVYGIIRQSGGNVWVYSEPDAGTTFKIYLPRIDVVSRAGMAEREPAPPPRGHETILLVEDEDLVRQITRRILEQNGYAVLEAPNGQEALKIYEKHEGPIHLLLTDLVMPGLNGRQLADRLASGPRRLKVLFMSGYAENSLVPEAAPGGEVVYLQKPFEAHLLTRTVRELLDAA